jgi:hypothetical protein
MSSGEGKSKRRAESHTEAWDGRQRDQSTRGIRGIPRGISALPEPLTLLHQCQEVTGWGGRKPSVSIVFFGLVDGSTDLGRLLGRNGGLGRVKLGSALSGHSRTSDE